MSRRFFHYLVLGVLFASLLCPTFAFARGGGGHSFGGGGRSSFGGGSSRSSWGGRSSSSSSSRSGWGGSSSSSGWGSSRRSTPSSQPSFSGSRPSSPSNTMSGADRALYQKAKTNGTAFNNRDTAVNSFRQQYGNQYTSRFSSEPSSRPSYIPQSYNVRGRNVTIIYNRGYGGYGYMDPWTHSWIMYDMWADHMMMDRMMMSRGYYYGSPYGYSHPFNWFGFFLVVILIIVVFVLIARWSRAHQQDSTTIITEDDDGYTTTQTIYSTPAAMPDQPSRRAPPPQPKVPMTGPAALWYNLPVGSVVSLSDAQAREDSLKEGRTTMSRDYTVQEIRTIEETHGLAIWKLYRIHEVEQDLWLMAKIVDHEVELRTYFELPEDQFMPGNRRDMVERDALWLFQQPEDPDDFDYNDLEFTTEIPGPEEDGQPSVIFQLKGQGVLHGNLTSAPAQQPGGRTFISIAEYRANAACANPELLLLETGGVSLDEDIPDSEEGGLITLWQGAPLAPEEVDVLQNQGPVK